MSLLDEFIDDLNAAIQEAERANSHSMNRKQTISQVQGIVPELLDAGHEVVGMDCVGGARIRVGDITRLEDCVAACEGADVVIHSAGIHSAGQVAENPMQMVDVNVKGTLNILQAAERAGTRRIVYLSSAKVYGEPERLPSLETDLPRPREPYALAKLAAEQYCQNFHDTCGMEAVVIRPFSVYGPGQEPNSGYVGMALEALRTNGVVSFPGRADYLRDFVHISDVARLCALASRSWSKTPPV